tara:strand:- start:2110 stop:2712 length:603 start_codon:yes stop_codon:yes gene_type:complete
MEQNYANNDLKNLVTYNDQGKILLCQSGPDDSLIPAQEKSELNTVYNDESVTSEHHYVDLTSNKVRKKGDKPSKGYIFDYDSAQWVFDIAEARQKKWEEIRELRTFQEFSSFEFQGSQIESDEISQRRLQGAVQMAAINPSVIIDWTMEDNSVVSLTAPQIIDMGTALGAHVTATHSRGRILRQLISEAETEQQLELINW